MFPDAAARVLEADALHRYGLTELLTDPEVLRAAEPTEELLRAILMFKDRMPPPVLDEARLIVRRVLEALRGRIERQSLPALQGRRGERQQAPLKTFRNVDWHGTIRRNLRRWDVQERRLVPERLRFHHRQQRRSAWRVIIAVDQSGSMVDSLVHAAIVAAIMASLPAVTVHLLLWDHRVVDMSDHVHDPLEVLMSSQLGGGTRMLPALRAAAALVTEPRQTVLAVVSDFFLMAERGAVLRMGEELMDAGITCLGLGALDDLGRSTFDEAYGRQLAAVGWRMGAWTPKALVEELAHTLA